MGDFKDLIVWQRGIEVARDVYAATRKFPREALYGLTSQARRAAIAISTHIAEGSGRYSPVDQVRFFRISMGSARELESLLIVSTALDLLATADRDSLCELVR